MDLKIKDVAELLNVSETTVRRWLTNGRIPAYKINHQYRFSRIEIENWMMSCKVKTPDGREEAIYAAPEHDGPVSGGHQQFSFFRALHKGDVHKVAEKWSKEVLFGQIMRVMAPTMGLDANVLTEMLLDRERLMPTSINHGVAVPHARELVFSSPADYISVIFLDKPMEYGALDGEPVHTLFFLFSGSDKRHLHLLSKIAHFCSQKNAVEFLKTAPSKEQLLTFVKTWESKIN